jgi:hypothetical protein
MRTFYLTYEVRGNYGQQVGFGCTEGKMPADAKLTYAAIQNWADLIGDTVDVPAGRVVITFIQELEA